MFPHREANLSGEPADPISPQRGVSTSHPLPHPMGDGKQLQCHTWGQHQITLQVADQKGMGGAKHDAWSPMKI